MKVKLIDMEEGVIAFLSEIVGTMPTTGHKFLAGAMIAARTKSIEDALSSLADEDGCVDTDIVRKAAQAGFRASGDKVSFTISDERLSWLVKPVTVNLTLSDIESAISSVERKYA